MKRLAFLYDNAMLYKDITQWMRNKTFLVLFIGLLAVCEIVALITATLPAESTQMGLIMFYILCVPLGIYSLAILGASGNLTSREFHDRTFELYEMSGMSLERMVFGKILSMLYQFAFGYFCIIPFMFFAYLLGGLDFSTIFIVTVAVAFVVLPLYLCGLLLSLLARFRKVSGLGRGAGIIFLIFIILTIGRTFLFVLFFRGSRSPFGFLASFFSFTPTGLLHVAVVLFFYAQICLLLFYLCCNAITRSTDSRETHVKAYLFSLLTTWMVTMTVLAMKRYNEAFYYLLTFPAGCVFLLAGMMFYFNRLDVPIVIRKRYEEARIMRKRLYRIFEPGARGGFRWLVYVYLVGLACAGFIWFTGKNDPRFANDAEEFAHAFSLMLQIPFFLAVPGALLLAYKKFQNQHGQVRTISLLWWAIAGAIISVIYGFLSEYRLHPEISGYRTLAEFIGIFVSPISSFLGGFDNNSDMQGFAAMVRFFTGALGLYLLNVFLRQRIAMQPDLAPTFSRPPDLEESWRMQEASIPAEEKLRDTP